MTRLLIIAGNIAGASINAGFFVATGSPVNAAVAVAAALVAIFLSVEAT